MTRPYEHRIMNEYRRARLMVCCDRCHSYAHFDDIVWRGPDGKLAICTDCEPDCMGRRRAQGDNQR